MQAPATMIKPRLLGNEMRAFTFSEYDRELKEVKTFTEYGDGTRARLQLANMFRFHKSGAILYHIKEIENVRENLPHLLKEYRDRETDFVLDNIKYFYGEIVYQEAKAAL